MALLSSLKEVDRIVEREISSLFRELLLPFPGLPFYLRGTKSIANSVSVSEAAIRICPGACV